MKYKCEKDQDIYVNVNPDIQIDGCSYDDKKYNEDATYHRH